MADFPGANAEPLANPLVWALTLVLLGASAVLAAKIFGLIFMRGKTSHRLGDAMSARAQVTEWSGGEGYVIAGGERWRAASNDALEPGDNVTVAAMNGLVLRVKKKNNA